MRLASIFEARKTVWIPAALFAAALALYQAFPTKVLYWDGAGFALAVDHPGWFKMIEPNHPVYIGFGWAVHALFPGSLSITVLQRLNSVLGAIGVVLVYLIARAVVEPAFSPAVLLAGLFAVSGTWWKFATDADAYVPSVLFLLIAAWLLLPGRPARPVLLALVHTCAMLFHELAVLFVVPAVVGLYCQRRGVARYLLVAFGATSAAYYFCFHLATGQDSLPDYWRWITWHTPDSSFSFSTPRDAWWTVLGTVRLFAGGKIRAFHSGFVELTTLTTLLAGSTVLFCRAEKESSRPRMPVFLWSWIAVYVAFLFFWLPQNTFYRLFYLPPLVLLTWGRARVLYAAVCFLGVWNYLFYIHPDSLPETNPLVVAAEAMHPVWRPGTWVYLGSFNADNWTILCFNPQVRFKNLDRSTLAAEIAIFAKQGHETWIDESGIDLLNSDPAGKQWLAAHTRPGFRLEFPDREDRIGFERLFP